MRNLIACAGLAALLAGCGPSDISECKTRAAQAPTEQGVTLASHQCEVKFGLPQSLPQFDDSEFRAKKSTK